MTPMRPLACLVIVCLGLAGGCGRATPPANPSQAAQPVPTLTSADVVRHQMLALQHNDTPTRDAGAAIAFRFASPENRIYTGPVERFAQMVHAPQYAPMLGCRRFELFDAPPDDAGPAPDDQEAENDPNFARHLVRVDAADGSQWHYVFLVRRQTEGNYTGCWMVDAVMPLAPTPDVVPPQPVPPPPDNSRIPV